MSKFKVGDVVKRSKPHRNFLKRLKKPPVVGDVGVVTGVMATKQHYMVRYFNGCVCSNYYDNIELVGNDESTVKTDGHSA